MRSDYLVSMGGVDVTSDVLALRFRQPPKTIWREFVLELPIGFPVDDKARWNIWGSHDATTNPKAECLIRDGVVPVDRPEAVTISREGGPVLSVTGYDSVWLALRRRPSETLVFVPGDGSSQIDVDGQPVTVQSSVDAALARAAWPVGRYSVVFHMDTLHDALRWLAAAVGFNIDIRLPTYRLQAMVLDPTQSYWTALMSLADPHRPRTYYLDHINTVVLASPLTEKQDVYQGDVMRLPVGAIKVLQARPSHRRMVRRVIIGVRPWR